MSFAREIKNALITSTSLGFGHGGFSSYLQLDYGGSGQAFGGYCLWNLNREDKNGTWGASYIEGVLNAVGVDTWEELAGQHVRVDAEHGKVHGIGHYIKDKWFYPKKDLAHIKED